MIFNLFLAFIVSPACASLCSKGRRVSSAADTVEGVLHEVAEAGKEARLIGSLD